MRNAKDIKIKFLCANVQSYMVCKCMCVLMHMTMYMYVLDKVQAVSSMEGLTRLIHSVSAYRLYPWFYAQQFSFAHHPRTTIHTQNRR